MSANAPTPRPSAAVYRRRRLIVGAAALGVLVLFVWTIGFSLVTLSRPLPAAALTLNITTETVGAPAELALPSVGRMGLGAAGFDGLIAHSGDQGEAPIASITKVVTALVVLDAKPITPGTDGETLTLTDADVAIRASVIAQNGSNAPVSAGLQLSERQALTVMLLPSANNYAISLANWAFGSNEAFVSAASNWLAAHGLSHTRVTEPTGLSPLNVSTPADLVRLGQLAESEPTVADIVDEPRASIPGVGDVVNTNTLLGQRGIIGIKTGTTDEAGSCLLFAANIPVGGQTVLAVGVLLGGSSHESVDNAVLDLVTSAAASFREIPIVAAGSAVATVTTDWGARAQLIPTASATLVSFGDIPVTATVDLPALTTGAAGQNVGAVVTQSGNQQLRIPLQLDHDLPDPGPWWRLTHADQLG